MDEYVTKAELEQAVLAFKKANIHDVLTHGNIRASIEMLEIVENPTVSVTCDDQEPMNITFHFRIPRGLKGEAGTPGIIGPKGDKGDPGESVVGPKGDPADKDAIVDELAERVSDMFVEYENEHLDIVRRLRNDLDAVTVKVTNSEQTLQNVQTSVSAMDVAISTINTNIEQLGAQTTVINDQIAGLTTRMDRYEASDEPQLPAA